jgi:hypothetical protein
MQERSRVQNIVSEIDSYAPRLRLSRHTAATAATAAPITPTTPGKHDVTDPEATTGLSSMASSTGS